MKCPKCGFETMTPDISFGELMMSYFVITIFGVGVVGIGCLLLVTR